MFVHVIQIVMDSCYTKNKRVDGIQCSDFFRHYLNHIDFSPPGKEYLGELIFIQVDDAVGFKRLSG